MSQEDGTERTMKRRCLLIDDNTVDLEAIKRAILKSGLAIELEYAEDGQEALGILKQNYAESKPRPYLTLLDLNMPNIDGFEFLDAIRNDPAFCEMVVFVLTTSDNPCDVKRAYRYKIAGYLVKNNQGLRYEKLIDLLSAYVNAVEPTPVAG